MKQNNDKTTGAQAILLISRKDGEIVLRYNGEKVFSAAGDGSDAKTRQELLAALRETVLRMPPEEAAKVIEQGIAVDFAAPDLEEFIQNEAGINTRRV